MRNGYMMIVMAVGIVLSLPMLADSRAGPSLWHRAASAERVEGMSVKLAPQEPRQVVMRPARTLEINGHELRAFARFSIEALVLGRHDYRFDRTAGFSPTDLALGWGGMSNPEEVATMEISQRGRFMYWQPGPQTRLDPDEIKRSSANIHLVFPDAARRRVLKQIGKGDVVAIEGYLVDVTGPNGARWHSSRVRDDGGAGACEILLVERIRRVDAPAG